MLRPAWLNPRDQYTAPGRTNGGTVAGTALTGERVVKWEQGVNKYYYYQSRLGGLDEGKRPTGQVLGPPMRRGIHATWPVLCRRECGRIGLS